MEVINAYINEVNKHYTSGKATEHTYRGALGALLSGLLPDADVINEPKRQACGAPDYMLTKKTKGNNVLDFGYVEAKDIGEPLTGKKHKKQFDRYRDALSNLIITDYLDFHFYREGEKTTSIRIAEVDDGEVQGKPEKYQTLVRYVTDFSSYQGQTIQSAETLAKLMAGKAKLLADVIKNALDQDIDKNVQSQLQGEYYSFQDNLIEDLSTSDFADIYAQTVAYGMFAARYNDPTLPTFSRSEAATLIPESSPFLRKLFNQIAGNDLDDRLLWIVDSLVEIFHATDVADLLKEYGKSTSQDDPIIHFYETFLGEYDPKLKKSRGVWYTPKPVVEFIVRAVDDILKNEFSLEEGLADESKTTIHVDTPRQVGRGRDRRTIIDKKPEDVHKVQILDPACGTGTFLAETIKYIHKGFADMQGEWTGYVDEHLIPRVNGFEVLMASYAMAHMQLSLLLKETGYEKQKHDRFNIYLTNSLEEHHRDTGNLFSQWLAEESKIANRIKRDTPVMVILGNPPYSGESSNKGQWITDLMDDYKKEPGGKEKLKERNPKWINDDYVKFLRYGQHFIEKNGEGVLAFINPHGFLDNPTFRGMRWSLLKTYDTIYTIDLHGNSNKKETAPDGGADVNVFDIKQGVSINLFIKTGKKKGRKLADVYHYDLYGSRKEKYKFLSQSSLKDIKFSKLENQKPMYFMVQRDLELLKKYKKGFSLKNLFSVSSVGIVTARDTFTIHSDYQSVRNTLDLFLGISDEEARLRFNLGKDVRDWKVSLARKDVLTHGNHDKDIIPISYRPFDIRYTYFTGASKGFHCMPRGKVMKHMVRENVGLITARSNKSPDCDHFYVTENIMEAKCGERTTQSAIFPLYLHPDDGSERAPNFNKDEIKKLESSLKMVFTPEKDEVDSGQRTADSFAPIDILDYIYAVLHTPAYREKYKEFLKTDFPRVPYPKDKKLFWKLVAIGAQIRAAHLMTSDKLNQSIAQYKGSGDGVITRKIVKADCETHGDDNELMRIYINDDQFFESIPLAIWNFTIGGYQPAQKWLKDRQGQKLDRSGIKHYFKIINALSETDRLMQELDGMWKP